MIALALFFDRESTGGAKTFGRSRVNSGGLCRTTGSLIFAAIQGRPELLVFVALPIAE